MEFSLLFEAPSNSKSTVGIGVLKNRHSTAIDTLIGEL